MQNLRHIEKFVMNNIQLKESTIEPPKQHIAKIMNTYTSPEFYESMRLLRKYPPGILDGKDKFNTRPYPYSFHGTCPPGQIINFQGRSGVKA